MNSETQSEARKILHARHFGVLGTTSVKFEGFPFGSVVPYCVDGKGRPVVLISTIAQHTKNITADDRCSLTIAVEADDVQAEGRLCIMGNLKKLPRDAEGAESVKELYFRHFPQARSYGQAHDFSFYYLDPITVRYIGGFGAIYWLEPADFLQVNPFQGKAEQQIVDHMNADHQANLRGYLKHFKGMDVAPDADVRMVGINASGFDVYVDKLKVRFEPNAFGFENGIQNAAEAREALVAMAKVVR